MGLISLLNTSQAFLADHRSLDRHIQSPRGTIRGTGTKKECVFGRTPAHLSLTYAPTYRGLLLLVNQNGLRRLPTFLNDWSRVDHDLPRFTTMTPTRYGVRHWYRPHTPYTRSLASFYHDTLTNRQMSLIRTVGHEPVRAIYYIMNPERIRSS